jgi:hypothetical protein
VSVQPFSNNYPNSSSNPLYRTPQQDRINQSIAINNSNNQTQNDRKSANNLGSWKIPEYEVTWKGQNQNGSLRFVPKDQTRPGDFGYSDIIHHRDMDKSVFPTGLYLRVKDFHNLKEGILDDQGNSRWLIRLKNRLSGGHMNAKLFNKGFLEKLGNINLDQTAFGQNFGNLFLGFMNLVAKYYKKYLKNLENYHFSDSLNFFAP